jgi:ribose/xylose/arabinose/galactoside ABC-type transport system permease subunit
MGPRLGGAAVPRWVVGCTVRVVAAGYGGWQAGGGSGGEWVPASGPHGPAAGPWTGPGSGSGPSREHLVPSAVTLALGCVVALAMHLSAGDVPERYLGDNVLPFGLALAALAAPVALLVSWGEVDLTSFGMFPFAGYVYSELGDSGVLIGLLAAGMAGLAVGATIGVLRWLTRAPSAVLTLGAAFVLQAVTFELVGGPDMRPLDDGVVDGWGLSLVAALMFTALSAGVAIGLGRAAGDGDGDGRGDGGGRPTGGPRPEVIVGFGLSGAAAATYGALAAAMTQVVSIGGSDNLLLMVFCAVAIAGAVRGNTLVAPIAAAIGALATQLLIASSILKGWEPSSQQLMVASVLVACLLIAHALHRVLGARPRAIPTASPAPPPPPLGAAVGSAPPPAPWPPPPQP